jgi:hypothetical protein
MYRRIDTVKSGSAGEMLVLLDSRRMEAVSVICSGERPSWWQQIGIEVSWWLSLAFCSVVVALDVQLGYQTGISGTTIGSEILDDRIDDDGRPQIDADIDGILLCW